jgi:segregation and condensation protein A
LLQYRAYKEIASWFETTFELEGKRIPRAVRLEDKFKESRPELVWTLSLADFAKLAEDALTPKVIPGVGLTHLHAPKVSIREQAQLMVNRLRSQNRLTFRELIADSKDRAELVARFLGLLELYRIGAVGFQQDNPFSDFMVSWEAVNFTDEDLSQLGEQYGS